MSTSAFLRHAHTLLQHGLDLLLPPRCAGCQRSGSLLCHSCEQQIQPFSSPLCLRCGTPLAHEQEACAPCQYKRLSLHGLRALNHYQGPLRNAIHALKYDGQKRLAQPLGLLLAQAFRSYSLRADALVPLPLHAQREHQRGYNQATLLASVCAAELRLPCLENLVLRQRATQTQVGLTFRERQMNIAGAFALTPGSHTWLHSAPILVIIDDVSTTGASLEACAAPLYAAGAAQVWGLVLSKPSYAGQNLPQTHV